MHPETVDRRTRSVLEKIRGLDSVGDFYLAGGTALAILLGHRISIDLDFFSGADFDTAEIRKALSDIGEVVVGGEESGTLHCLVDGVKVSFLRYRYATLFPFVDFDGVRLADERDIAAMKIDAVSSRGSRKDFIDLYFLLKRYPLGELLRFFEEKFSGIGFNTLHILKSLVYFDDAEGDPMPMMMSDIRWDEVKRTIVGHVLAFEKQSLG